MPWLAWHGALLLMINEGAFTQLTHWSNLLLAYKKASKGKRGKMEVAAFEARLEENLCALHERLQARIWRPAGYQHFLIHDPKRRLISAAPFADRVVHHALCNIIEPVLERSFVAESYANRLGMGNHRALNHAQRCARQYGYVLALDIRQFFPSIDHALLRSVLARKIQDGGILWLIDRILDSGCDLFEANSAPVLLPGDDLVDQMRPRGLPIGNLTSQLWGNVYLNPLDHCIKRQLGCRGYARYVDDLLLFADSKTQLWEWKARIEERLTRLRLVIHHGSHPRPVAEGFSFLGFRVFPEKRRLKRRKGVQYQRQLKQMISDYSVGQLAEEALLASLLAWNNHASYGNTIGLRKTIFARLPKEIANAARERFLISLRRRVNRAHAVKATNVSSVGQRE